MGYAYVMNPALCRCTPEAYRVFCPQPRFYRAGGCPERNPQPFCRFPDCLFSFLFVFCVPLFPPPHPITFFHRQNVLINLLLLFPDLTWWPTQSTALTKRSLRDKTHLTSEEQGKCFRGRVQFLTWTPTRTGADPGRGGREEGLSLSRVCIC